MGTLKRQASKALRFKRLRHRLTHLDLAWQGFQYTKRREAVVALEAQAISLRQLVNASAGHLKERESVVTAAKLERVRLHEKLQEAQQVAFNLRSEKENAENQARFAEVRSQDLRERIRQVDNELAGLAAREAGAASRASKANPAPRRCTPATPKAPRRPVDVRVRQREARRGPAAASANPNPTCARSGRDLLMAENEITRHGPR